MTNTSIIGNFPKNKTAGNLKLVKKNAKVNHRAGTFNVLRAEIAASSAGIASASSASHSSFKACDSPACWLATASSSRTISRWASAIDDSFSITYK